MLDPDEHDEHDDQPLPLGFDLDAPLDETLERIFAAVECAGEVLLSPLGWLAAVQAAAGPVGALARQAAHAAMPTSDAPALDRDAWIDALDRLAVTALQAASAHSIPARPGTPTAALDILGLGYWGVAELVRESLWIDGDQAEWNGRIALKLADYFRLVAAGGAVDPLPADAGDPPQMAGPGALAIGAAAMLAGTVAARDGA